MRNSTALLALALTACTADETRFDDAEPPDGGMGVPMQSFWRVDLRGSASDVTIVGVARVEIPATQHPIPSLGDQYMVVARAGSELRAVIPIRFPDHATIESLCSDGAAVASRIELAESMTSVFVPLDAAVDRIDVVDVANTVRATTASLPRSLARSNLRAPYQSVRVYGASDRLLLPGAFICTDGPVCVEALRDPTDTQLESFASGLAKISARSLDATREVAVAKFVGGGLQSNGSVVLAAALGSTFIMNEAMFDAPTSDAERDAVIVHEAAHNFTHLLEFRGDPTFGSWPAELREHARDLLFDLRLGSGLVDLVDSIHATGLRANVALPYRGDAAFGITDNEAINGGFATNYGSTNAVEDIAEIVASVQFAAGLDRNRNFCPYFRTFGPRLTDKNALPYIKAKTLTAFGLIDEDRFEECLGEIEVSAGPGVHLGVTNAGDTITFDSATTRVVDEGFGPRIVVQAANAGYMVKLTINAEIANGLGVHQLDHPEGYGNEIELVRTSDNESRKSKAGLFVVTAVTATSTEGAAFFVELANNVEFVTDEFPLSTFAVAQ